MRFVNFLFISIYSCANLKHAHQTGRGSNTVEMSRSYDTTLRNRYFGRFHVILEMALPTDDPTRSNPNLQATYKIQVHSIHVQHVSCLDRSTLLLYYVFYVPADIVQHFNDGADDGGENRRRQTNAGFAAIRRHQLSKRQRGQFTTLRLSDHVHFVNLHIELNVIEWKYKFEQRLWRENIYL